MDCFVAYAPRNDDAFLREPDGDKVEAVCHRAA
jgi:hypothetical protein